MDEAFNARKEGIGAMVISVCVGSSCFLRGAPRVLEALQREIAVHRLEQKVVLKGSFCLNSCTRGVTIVIDDQVFTGVVPEAVPELFVSHVLAKLAID
ncbi:MAG: (2Fe-2S) ferredoxin domain-containing protein [Bacillota bacterium]